MWNNVQTVEFLISGRFFHFLSYIECIKRKKCRIVEEKKNWLKKSSKKEWEKRYNTFISLSLLPLTLSLFSEVDFAWYIAIESLSCFQCAEWKKTLKKKEREREREREKNSIQLLNYFSYPHLILFANTSSMYPHYGRRVKRDSLDSDHEEQNLWTSQAIRVTKIFFSLSCSLFPKNMCIEILLWKREKWQLLVTFRNIVITTLFKEMKKDRYRISH